MCCASALATTIDFDFTKKGNVFEETLRMPFNIWGSAIKISISFKTNKIRQQSLFVKDKKHPEGEIVEYIVNKSEWSDNLYHLWKPYSCKHEKTQEKQDNCFFQEERDSKHYTKLLESYHPNQLFKFKLTFMPISNPQEKIEKIIEFPLYHKPKNYFDIPQLEYDCCSIKLFYKSTEFLKRYYIRLEVLNNVILPPEVINLKLHYYNPSTKH